MKVQVQESIAGECWDEDAGKPLFCVCVCLEKRADGDVSRMPYYKQVQAVTHFDLWDMGDGSFCGGDYLNKQDAEDMAEKVRGTRKKKDQSASLPTSVPTTGPASAPETQPEAGSETVQQ